MTASIEFDDQIGREPQFRQLFRRFAGAQPLEHEQCILKLGVGIRLAQRRRGICRQEAELDADALRPGQKLTHVAGGPFHDIDCARTLGVDLRHPERLHRDLITFHAMAEIAGLLRRALRIDEHRQVPGDPDRIHGVEEEGAMSAEQVLDIVLGGRQQHIDAGVVHQLIEPRRVEGRCTVSLAHVEHDRSPGAKGRPSTLSNPMMDKKRLRRARSSELRNRDTRPCGRI